MPSGRILPTLILLSMFFAAARTGAQAPTPIWRALWDVNSPHVIEGETLDVAFNPSIPENWQLLGEGWREPIDKRLVLRADAIWSTSLVSDLNLVVLRPRPLILTLTLQPMVVPKLGP